MVWYMYSHEKKWAYSLVMSTRVLSQHRTAYHTGTRVLAGKPKLSPFLVQSFKETLQYCDEWRKFKSVGQSVIV